MANDSTSSPFLAGGGEMGERIRSFDWSATPLGSPKLWPQSLRSALSICLNSSFPTAIYWGAELRLFYNDAWASIPADKHPWALGRPAREVWSDIWQVVGPQFEQVMQGGQGLSTFDQLLPMERAGEVHETYWNYSLTPILDDAGKVAGVFNQGHETTAQVIARREREAEFERLREMFEQAPGAVALLQGPQHIFEIANAAYLRLIDREDVIGKPVASALPEIVGQGFITLLDEVYKSGKAHVGRNVAVRLQRGQHADFEERLLDFIYQPIRSVGEVTGIFVQATDVTERAMAEASLQALNATLEQRIEEEVERRSQAEQKLQQMQKMEAIGQLTGGIAHDFNNMLAVVIGGLNLARRRLARGDTDVAAYIEGAAEGAQRAASLTRRLLAFARQQPLEPVPVDANRMIEEMTELLARTIGQAVRIATKFHEGLWLVRADRSQLESVLLNLVVNARDAMKTGGTLTIATSNALIDHDSALDLSIAEGEYVSIGVTDVGTGMTPEVRARAFDPFFTTKPLGAGTGLGLSQVFGFVNQSGGHVKIDTEVGSGTTVTIYLPRFQGAAETRPQRISTAAPIGRADEIVLVVEDEPRVRTFSTDALNELGYTAIAAASAEEALQIIGSGRTISLLFTDIIMPGMSGWQLAEIAAQAVPSMKVVFTSGFARDSATPDGAPRAVLMKPFSIEQLALKVREALDA